MKLLPWDRKKVRYSEKFDLYEFDLYIGFYIEQRRIKFGTWGKVRHVEKVDLPGFDLPKLYCRS